MIKVIEGIRENKLVENIGWLFFDKLLIIALQFLVGVKIANHYGAIEYGIYSYAVALILFSPILLELINDRIVKKYFEDENHLIVISSVNYFKGMTSIIILFVIIFSKIFYSIEIKLYYILILLAIDNIFMNYTLGIKSYFEYKLESKIVVKIDAQIKIFYYFLQYIVISLNYSLYIIILVRVLGSLIRAILIFKGYRLKFKERIKLGCNLEILLKILRESRYLWLAAISYILYAQLDKIMIGRMISIKEVGVYNIAFQLMSFMLIPIEVIRVSYYPILWKSYKMEYTDYIRKYRYITLYLTQFYILFSLLSYFLLPKVFNLVYSKEYDGAIMIFNCLLLGIVIRGNEIFQYTHYTFKELTKFLLYKQICGLVLNIILNFILIQKLGAMGAALATSLTLVFTRVIFDSIFTQTREIFKIQLWAFNTSKIFNMKKDMS